MSNFPYNHHKYNNTEGINGSPLNYQEARELADKILMWHSYIDTDDWTQSGDGHEWDVIQMAFGLMELFSDPGAVRRIIYTGETIRKHVETMLKVKDMAGISDSRKNDATVIEKLLESEQ